MAEEDPGQAVFRIRIKYRGRRLPWRVVEVLAAMSIGSFDRYLRSLFHIDSGDKLSAFYRRTKLVFTVDPWEQVGPGVLEDLFRGTEDRLLWVYNNEPDPHQLILTDVVSSTIGAEYPALVRSSHPEYRTCACGVTPATWYCDSCSEREGMLVTLCDDCMVKGHLPHRVSRVVY